MTNSVKKVATITRKDAMLEPAGVCIRNYLALPSGFDKIQSVRIGTLVRLTLDGSKHPETDLNKRATEICDRLGLVELAASVNVQDDVADGSLSAGKTTGSVHIVDALIRSKPEAPCNADARLLDTAKKLGYDDLTEIYPAQMVRMEVEAPTKTEAVAYVNRFGAERGLINPVYQMLELR